MYSKQNLVDRSFYFSRALLAKIQKLWRRGSLPAVKRRLRPAFYQVEYLEDRTLLAAGFAEFVDPNPSVGNFFGDTILPLSTGNVVITSPFDDAGGTDAGAVYLFNGTTGVLISTLTGSTDYDVVGIDGVTALTNGNYVISSSEWGNGTATEAGAVTFGNGITGVSGVVSAANSLVGTQTDDYVGYNDNGVSAVTPLANGNYVVTNPYWDNGGIADVGAVTFGDGTTGVSGVITSTNSLIGTSSDDRLGYVDYEQPSVTALTNGNYVVSSPSWDNGSETDAGAVTFGDGTSGVSGMVSSTNSLIGSTADDGVGYGSYGRSAVTVLSNGNYVVNTPYWDDGSKEDVGAATFGNGLSGVSGLISSTNSLIGGSEYDYVGFDGVTPLSTGNYVVNSADWNNGIAFSAGAVTFGNGTTGVTGVVSAANSLVGDAADDYVGIDGITELANGNYVVSSSEWSNGSATEAGAVTFGNGHTGVSGVVSAANSLVGTQTDDYVGYNDNGVSAVTALANGNYVVTNPYWDNNTVTDAGAVTFGNGTTGVSGTINSTNSLIGSTSDDRLGFVDYELPSVIALSNGNYVVSSPNWDNGSEIDAGAVTFGNGGTGVSGTITSTNSLIGESEYDQVGYVDYDVAPVTALTNGNYVVSSPNWDNGAVTDAGAVTFGNGITGVNGLITSTNSLIGESEYDYVGTLSSEISAVTALTNGNYVVSSPNWDSGLTSDVGAVTLGDGSSGVSGLISSTNSLVGGSEYDYVGFDGVTALFNGNYVVRSPYWDNGLEFDAGAVTFGDGTTGVKGVLSDTNSLVGSFSNEVLGYNYSGPDGPVSPVTPFSNGNYLVHSPYWDSGTGAVTFGGMAGVSGPITADYSVSGLSSIYSSPEIVQDEVNGTFFLVMDSIEKIFVGSLEDGFPSVSLDPIDDVILKENASAQIVDLEGIFASGFESNSLSVTATSSNTSLVPHPVVTYTSPDSTGSLAFTPASNQVGVATITVTVEDGGLDGVLGTSEDNATIQHTFDVVVLNYLVFTNLRVVDTPTVGDVNGEITVLPENQDGVNEWDSYWVEIWVSTEELDSQGIAEVTLDLGYQTDYTSATEIEFGPAFTQNQTGTINDVTGVVSGLSAGTAIADLGIETHLLFARIKFESLVDDQVALDLVGQSIGLNDLEFEILTPFMDLGTVQNVTPYVVPYLGAFIWANPFDLNDNDIVDFRDLILFAAVYNDIPSESSNDYAWFSDYDQNDKINFRDLILFASNYRKDKVNNPDINFPDVWDDLLLVSAEPPIKTKAARLTQAAADQVLEKAIEQASEQLTLEQNQILSDVDVKIVDLSGAKLGFAGPGTIYLDVNAAGYGWFVDSTPLDHSEFSYDSPLTLIALPESAAAGRFDLLTVIMHELGHLLGYEHEDVGVMEETLSPGVRKLAEWENDADQYFTSLQDESALLPFE